LFIAEVLLFQETLNEDSLGAIHCGLGTADGHDLSEVVGCGGAESGEAVAAGIMFFVDEEVNVAGLGNEADGLTAGDALLASGGMLVTVLAELEVAGKIENFAGQGDCLARDGLVVDGCAVGGVGPEIDTLLAEFTSGCPATSWLHAGLQHACCCFRSCFRGGGGSFVLGKREACREGNGNYA
jgi:hypothetical protein